MRVALISLDTAWEDKEENKRRCTDALMWAGRVGSDLVIFPEMTLTGFSMHIESTAEDRIDPPSLAWYRQQSRRFGVAIIAGLVRWNSDGTKGENTSVFISRDGDVLATYVKTHPFTLSGEARHFEKGTKLASCEFAKTSFGLTICYDLRFPELYQGLSRSNEVIVNIASWPSLRAFHWNALLQARAIENQVFMIGVNRTGSDPDGLTFVSSSTVFSPFGNALAPVASEGAYALYEFDPAEAKREREVFPLKADRREDFYRDTCLTHT